MNQMISLEYLIDILKNFRYNFRVIQYIFSFHFWHKMGDTDNTHCSIVGFLGIIIQVALGVLSFSVLIIKRNFEQPKRPWRIWCYDTMKQGISQLLAHFINLLISLILTVEDPNSDTCLWYFITNIFDNTFGVFLSVMILRRI